MASTGNGSVVAEGGVHYRSVNPGVIHRPFNPSQTEEMGFLHVWLVPEVREGKPVYNTIDLAPADKDDARTLFLSPDGRDGSMRTRADASVYGAAPDGGQGTYWVLTGRAC